MSVLRFDDEGRMIVQMLKQALDDAEAGNITSLLIVAARNDGTTARALCPGSGIVALLGETRIAETHILEYLTELQSH